MSSDPRYKHLNSGSRIPAPSSPPNAAPTAKGTIIPPVLYLPTREISVGSHAPEVRMLPDGRRALIAYTALDRLAQRCGAAQSWMLVATEELGSLQQEAGFDVVSFDPFFAEHLIRGGKLQ